MSSLSARARIGFWIAVVLAVLDLPQFLFAAPPGTEGPPLEVMLFTTVMGVLTLVAAVLAWRGGRRSMLRAMAVTRILSAITALPAFVIDGVPPLFVAWAAATIVLAITAVVLLMSGPRRAPAVPQRS